ncbi:dTMP kinase [Limosilactobacillus fermentum]|uniref:dTMP kinase n=1 Tax=Limosilactobacillus fermentum TaxID=1613 RepID=UPI00038AEAA4|nr:dTMP kinase [Limosilactobacillus fermentum]EQC58740.1 thymidylate kinase [Limosilactobacillus fermentum MTCC 8711]AZI17925.1 thymidylate kinase [Limosilactobacillus fermentum]KLD56580.1 thymidylate kinase [Limosilactobacillus fermentum]MCT3429560.1 thymidylate kinase [Limosilactobacillus fermentum]MCT3440696.1 thymidylate kinase [Limosilactobacillus fermentum]
MSGRFISFEGPDGAGKTSVLTAIRTGLVNQLGDQVVYTREPGGNPIAEQVRAVLLDKQNGAMDDWTEALLYAASRRQHVVETLKPALEAGKLILCDRYLDSSIAYQGGGRELGIDQIWELNQYAIDGLLPDLTIFLDLPVETGLARIEKGRAETINRLDEQTTNFHRRVRQAYLTLAERFPERIVKVNADQELARVIEDVQSAIHARYADLFTN